MGVGSLGIYRSCTPVIDAQYDINSDRTPTEAVIEAVASAANVDPTELRPLYESIDPDAIDHLFDEHEGDTESNALLSFQIDSWNVFVRADGRIRICDATKLTAPTPVFESTSP